MLGDFSHIRGPVAVCDVRFEALKLLSGWSSSS